MGAFDPYRVLGIDARASGGDIRRAYHSLALRHHPDAAGDGSGERFVELHEAYRLLRDPGTRADYDRGRQAYAERRHRRQFAPPLTLTALFDAADAMLRGAVDALDLVAGGFVHEGRRRRAPEPLHYELTLSPLEAARGGRFRFAVPVRRRDRLLVEERALEVVVPPGVRDGTRAELSLDAIGADGVVDVTVRIE